MSVKINPILPKHQPSTNYKPKITPKVVDKTKQTNQAIRNLAVRFNGDDEPKPAKKTVDDFYRDLLKKNTLKPKDAKNMFEVEFSVGKSPQKASVEDYRKAFDTKLLTIAGYKMFDEREIGLARNLMKTEDSWTLKNIGLRDAKDGRQDGKLKAGTSKYSLEHTKIVGQAVLQFREYESKTFDKNQAHGRRYMPEALGGFVQPIVNAPVNVFNGLSEPFRAGEKMLFGTQNIPVIPRMEVAERSEYWNKDGRMFANKGAEIGATIVFGGGAGAKALATKGGRALLGVEASYNFASGTYGKDVTQPDANGNPRQMDYLERGGRVFGGVFGARQVVKAEITAPNSIVNKLDDIFKPKPPTTEAITPEGFRVKVPQTENVKGANVFESRANGFPNQRIPSSKGSWNGKVGESGWLSNKPEVIAVTGGKPVPFKNGFPIFDKWKVGEVKLPNMKGNHGSDFDEADKLYAKAKGWFKANGKEDGGKVALMRKNNGLTWHHHEDMTTMQLVPADLNNNVSHTGGASFVKRGNK